MDRVPCDCHCSYRCWSRTGEPAAGHPHRGGWYVFAKTKLQLQFQSTLLNLPCQILTALPISTNPPLLFYPLCLLLIWLSTLSSFNPIFGQCFFKRKETHFAKSTIFCLFYIPHLVRCSISTHGMAFSAEGLQTSSPNCHFWNFYRMSSYFSLFSFFFENLTNWGQWAKQKVEDFFWRPFFKKIFFVSRHVIQSFLTHFFSLLHSQNSCRASSSRNSWSLLWLHFSILAKRHFYSMFLKSTLPIFNVSTLGQLSDLFLRLVFTPPPYHCWNIDVMQCLLQFAALLWFLFFIFLVTAAFCASALGEIQKKRERKKKGVKGFSIIFTFFLLSHGVPPVPSGPPRKVEVEAVNSSSIKVIWRSPMPTKQHGQIRGYQVHYVRMVNGEPTGQPAIKDILIDDAQVQHPHPTLSQPPHLRHIMFFSLKITNYYYVSLIIYSA